MPNKLNLTSTPTHLLTLTSSIPQITTLAVFLLLVLAGKAQKRVDYSWDKFCMGVDLSYVNQVEDYGGVYRDSGRVGDPFKIMKAHGANTVRVRLWHTPSQIAKLNNGKFYYDLLGTEKTIRRAKEAGLAVNLDVHYSDTWADPAHQSTPAA